MPRRLPRKMCPVPGCGTEIIVSWLMCSPHWRTVPKGMRDRHQLAYKAWKAAVHSSPRDPDEMRVNTAALRASCERTIAEASARAGASS